jgi:hypothetical protein
MIRQDLNAYDLESFTSLGLVNRIVWKIEYIGIEAVRITFQYARVAQ